MKRASLLLFLVYAWLPMTAFAQVQGGTPPFGTFGGGPDVVNLANLNTHITIPVFNKAGRGIPFTFSLTQDSSIWYPVFSGSTKSWQPVTGWGWSQSEANIGSISVNVGRSGRPELCSDGSESEKTTTTYSGWAYTDGFHTTHPFSIVSTVVDDGCTNTITPSSAQGTATDDSGYQLSVYGGTITQLVDVKGTLINPATGAGSIEDSNGNLISIGNSGVITDTLGQTAITIAGSGTPASPYTFTYAAPGASAEYQEKFTAQTVQTSFGCTGISEFGPTSENLVSEIDLPDIGVVPSDKYTITYEATPGHPGNVTGRIASITLPTGGTISYSYSGGSNGITCADGSTATLTRTTPDGAWSYAHTESGTAWTTTIMDPQGNKTVDDFQGIYLTEQTVYQGTATLLDDDVTCYNTTTTNCNTTAITQPISKRTVTRKLGTEQCKHVYSYNSFGLVTEQDDYDYGSGAPGAELRKTLISYASLGNNIENRPASVTVETGSGTIVAQTTVTYDQGTPAATSGTPQHVSVSGSRGNATSISYLVAGSTTLNKSFTYFDTGNVDVATDVNGGTTTYNYANATSTCGNAFPTSVTEAISGLSQSMAWNCTGGVETSFTDENSNPASTTYSDSYFWRPASSNDQEQNTTNYAYANPNSVESSLVFNSNSSTTDMLAALDGLGRTLVTQRKQSPSSSSYDSVETNYDSLGRPYQTTVPYSGTAGQTNGSAPKTTTTYDALSRPTQTQDGGGGTVNLTYTANDVLQVVGPAPSGENPKQRRLEYNSIGQLTSVCEVTSLSGSGTCAQNTSATGYWTKYAYDAAGRLLTVTQNAQSAQAQARSFTYDDLGRMTSETNPETGTIHYVYDTDSTCGTYTGDLVRSTDAAGNLTCYVYDVLHRVTAIDPISGPNTANTPARYFFYDAATVNGQAMQNAKGRLAEARTANCGTCTVITDEGFSYTARGEESDEYESTPHSGGYYHASATYWANGVLQNLSAPIYGADYNVDGEGRVYSSSSALTSTIYNAASQPTAVTFDTGDSDTFTYDPNTFRMTQYKYTVGVTPQSVVGTLTWNANGSLGKLAITDPFNSANTQTCTYSHDDLARIASGNCGSVWSQTFTYDAFGNITKTGSNQFQPGYNWTTNQMSSGASYDANGDVLTDSLHSYAWDMHGRPTTIDTATVTYDALGRMVEQTKSGTSTEIEYSPTGFKLQLLNGQSSYLEQFTPLPGGTAKVWQGNGPDFYRHADWLGNSRFASTPSRTMYNDLAYAPFGEQYAQAGTTGVTNTSFAGNNGDTTTNLYDAQFREYGIQGRWPSPDPAGVAAVDSSNPQSWNRYAYVMNNPLSFVDPLGLQQLPPSTCYPLAASCEVFVPPTGPNDPYGFGLGAGDGRDANPVLIFMGGKNGGGGRSSGQPPQKQPCGTPNFLQKAEISLLGKIASWTGKTVGFGGGISGGVGSGVGVSGALSRQVVVSPNGQAALVTTVGTNAVPVGLTAGVGFLGGLQFSVSNVQSPLQLAGLGVSAGGSLVDGPGVGLDGSLSSGGWQGTLTLGGGVSFPGAFGGAGLLQSTGVQLVCR